MFQSEPTSVLARMFDNTNSLPPAKIVDGAYFIDANPDVFSVILDYLRYKTLVVPQTIPQQCIVVLARYFGLQSLLAQLGDRVNNQVSWWLVDLKTFHLAFLVGKSQCWRNNIRDNQKNFISAIKLLPRSDGQQRRVGDISGRLSESF